MPESFHCPNCSAPLDVAGITSPTLRCPYCLTSVIIPEELRNKSASVYISPGSPATHLPDSSSEMSEKLRFIREAAQAGNKIVAIKALRNTYSIPLKQAVDLVEAIQRGEELDLNQLQANVSSASPSKSLDPAVVQRILDHIKAGEKIEAIKQFREATGVSLKDAKQVIEGMEVTVSGTELGETPHAGAVIPYSLGIEAKRTGGNISTGTRSCIIPIVIIFAILITVVPILAALSSPGGPLALTWARINPFAMGRLTQSFGTKGTGPGYFTNARFIAVDNNGHIFVGEFDGGRIQVFDENGKYLTQWIAMGESQDDIYLSGMAADRNGAVYVVVGSQLYVYDGLTGDLLGRLDHPGGWGFTDVTVAPEGSVVAAWYKNQDDILRFSNQGQVDLLIQNAIQNVTNDSEMDMRVAVDGTGNIFALAYFNESVFVFSYAGEYMTRFGSSGDEEGQFTSPRSIAVDNLGRVFIADFAGVMVFSNDGRYLDTLPVTGAVMGMTFDDQNNLYLVTDDQVQRYTLK